jgi:hypothetical protein
LGPMEYFFLICEARGNQSQNMIHLFFFCPENIFINEI